jgi:SAM-dependent methyltransferase
MSQGSVYVEPREVESLDDCFFYHTMEIPGVGLVTGGFDLRAGVSDYLGGIGLQHKRVLEIGPGSGFLTFEMERRGASVVAYDLSDEEGTWDVVPYGGEPSEDNEAERHLSLRRLNNGFWFAHSRHGSKARVVYGSVYDVPEAIGAVDVATFGCVLLHLRDPFLALQRGLRLTRETVIITEAFQVHLASAARCLPSWLHTLLARNHRIPAHLGFLPRPNKMQPADSWWRLTPWTLGRMVGVLGFDVDRVTIHTQPNQGKPTTMFTLVARRRRWPAGDHLLLERYPSSSSP